MKAFWSTYFPFSVKLTDFDDDHEWNQFVYLIERDLRAFTIHFKNTFNSDELFCLAKIMILERPHTCFVFMSIRDVAAPSGNIGSQFLLESHILIILQKTE